MRNAQQVLFPPPSTHTTWPRNCAPTAAGGGGGLNAIAASRRTDPEPSHAAEREINHGLRSQQALAILALVREYVGATSTEMSGGDYRTAIIARKRLPDLEKLGKVRRGEPRKCNVSGRLLTTWWPV